MMKDGSVTVSPSPVTVIMPFAKSIHHSPGAHATAVSVQRKQALFEDCRDGTKSWKPWHVVWNNFQRLMQACIDHRRWTLAKEFWEGHVSKRFEIPLQNMTRSSSITWSTYAKCEPQSLKYLQVDRWKRHGNTQLEVNVALTSAATAGVRQSLATTMLGVNESTGALLLFGCRCSIFLCISVKCSTFLIL